MSTVRETNLIATLNRDLLVTFDLVAQDIAHVDLVLEGNDQMESTWMEG